MADTYSISQAFEELSPDEWRDANPFAQEFNDFHSQLFDPALTRRQKSEVATAWCASGHYPCLFGRMAAKKGLLSVLILEERDLLKSDQEIGSLIADSRTAWRDEALGGQKHALVLLAVSKRLAYAKPDKTLLAMASRLCELYLSMPVSPDRVYRDELFLGIENGASTKRLRWQVGVDNFAAQGDGRWWHHHRIPGGLGFSMNSVGHMVRAIVERAIALDPGLRDRTAHLTRDKLIQFALPLAMRTILTAQKHPWTGTCLKPRGPLDHELEAEVKNAPAMEGIKEWDVNTYEGFYHTDFTLRSEFFDPESKRPTVRMDLDFTYLHAKSELDYAAMSVGQEILAILGM